MNSFQYSPRRLTIAIALILIAPQAVLAGTNNTVLGTGALSSNTGSYDSAFGVNALHSSNSGDYNTAFGYTALFSNSSGSQNTAVGCGALYSNLDGTYNTAAGFNALYNNTSGNENVGFGVQALLSNTTGNNNTASGDMALLSNTTGNDNTASGVTALMTSNGDINTAIGYAALGNNSSGWGNTAVGYQALYNMSTGHNNVAIGNSAGYNLVGSNNIDIGDAGNAGDNNTTRLGNGSTNRVFFNGISGIRASGGVAVYINSAGQLGTTTSSARFKKDIKSIDGVSDKLLQLRPVSFIYKEDDKNELQYGLIAEEVAKVYPELVQYDQEGKPFTVYYHLLTPLLLSELQKSHATNEAQQGTMTAQLAKLQAQQTERAKLTQQLDAQNAQMVTLMQQQQQQQQRQQQQVAEMSALQQKINQLDNLLQANIASRSSAESVAMAPSH